jgi:hypothetical protein
MLRVEIIELVGGAVVHHLRSRVKHSKVGLPGIKCTETKSCTRSDRDQHCCYAG